MREDELKKQKTIKERLDFTEDARMKYLCTKCDGYHYIDSDIGIKHKQYIVKKTQIKTSETVFKDKKYGEWKIAEKELLIKKMELKSGHRMKKEEGAKRIKELADRYKKRQQEKSIKQYEKYLHEHYTDPEFIKMNLNAYKKDKKNIEI